MYSREGRTGVNFLNSIRAALKALAAINDERTTNFPLGSGDSECGLSRLSAHLHLFHHHVSHATHGKGDCEADKLRLRAVHNPQHKTVTVQLFTKACGDYATSPHSFFWGSTVVIASMCRLSPPDDEDPGRSTDSNAPRSVSGMDTFPHALHFSDPPQTFLFPSISNQPGLQP